MKGKSAVLRMIVMLAIVVAGLMMPALPGSAQDLLPPDATVTSATFSIYMWHVSFQTVYVHEVTANWTESGITYNNFGGSYLPAFDSFVADYPPGWRSVDVTTLVQDWVSGAKPNNGLLLEQADTPFTICRSSEYGESGLRPKLEVCYTSPSTGSGCVTIQRGLAGNVADAYISALYPDTNFGALPSLYTGLVNGYQKQSLVRFDLPVIPPGGGCTLTPGYWKTHSIYGPASYDEIWALIGEDTPFFLSDQSYYDVLWTAPRGNAYYILAHAYIAAELNFLNGADSTAAQDAFDAATALFDVYTPADVAGLKGAAKHAWTNLATILDNYNNGLIGPGHCEG